MIYLIKLITFSVGIGTMLIGIGLSMMSDGDKELGAALLIAILGATVMLYAVTG